MLKIIFLFVLVLHGLIHIFGFAKAYKFGNNFKLTVPISKQEGLIWLFTSLLFLLTAILFYFDLNLWMIFGILSVILSQVLIFKTWYDSKFATIINLLIFIVLFFSFTSYNFESDYKKDVRNRKAETKVELLTETDMMHLPIIVKKYLTVSGSINKPKVRNAKIIFEGKMRNKGNEYFDFTSEQFNFFDNPSRLFFIKGEMFGILVPGYHKYTDGNAKMSIKLFGLLSVEEQEGEIMNKTETVTLFNDMCLLAPATLIDKRIEWIEIDELTVKAIFENKGIKISALLFFKESGELENFLSYDRTNISEKKELPFYTPVLEYKSINGYYLMHKGEAVWEYPDGKFTYGLFLLKDIEYNVR